MGMDRLFDLQTPDANSAQLCLANGLQLRLEVMTSRMFRLRFSADGRWTESALNRYGIYCQPAATPKYTKVETADTLCLSTAEARLEVSRNDGRISLSNAKGECLVSQTQAPEVGKGFRYALRLADSERLYGLGDVSRENIMRRGEQYDIWVRNVKSYIPIPVLFSNRGWGILVNTTWRHQIDVGKSEPEQLICSAQQADADFYLFVGDGYPELLSEYTSFSGRPALLPVWAYALTYVCNQQVDAFNLMQDALNFRREEIPCDVIGLEPGWMSKNYDFSVDKSWHPERFYFPYWAPTGSHTFPAALQRLGFKLSLWLCCDHDLGVFEEQQLGNMGGMPEKEAKPVTPDVGEDDEDDDEDDFEKDEHFRKPRRTADAEASEDANMTPELPEPWFDHLRKFVDQGAVAFKLDGSNQVIEHPDRAWGNGMNDEQMHNLYPLIYGKQMMLGFEQYTNQRAMVYSAGGYTGIQQYVATWAGDTGGGPKPLASMLNHGFSGHSNHSCDMDVMCPDGIHFGFLQTWAQLNNWAYWRQPWHLEPAGKQMFQDYARLRYQLLPYLYSSAAQAYRSGMPVMRAMSMVCPDEPAWDLVRTQYMLGDFLLVTAYTEELHLPAGNWFDFWRGNIMTGPLVTKAEYPANRGGCLLVREGAMIPTWEVMSHAQKGYAEKVVFLVYPGATISKFELYEDDGQSLSYRDGDFCLTRLECRPNAAVINASQGKFAAQIGPRQASMVIHLPDKPTQMRLNDKEITDWTWQKEEKTATVTIANWNNDEQITVTWE